MKSRSISILCLAVLVETPTAFDVIGVAFATPSPYGSTMSPAPDPTIYPNAGDFVTDVQTLQADGKAVLISIGGAADPVVVDDPADVATFVSSTTEILLGAANNERRGHVVISR